VLEHRLPRGSLQSTGIVGILKFILERHEKGIGEFRQVSVGVPIRCPGKEQVTGDAEKEQKKSHNNGVPQSQPRTQGIKHGFSRSPDAVFSLLA
jgi:hypothetical protein